MCSWPGSRSLIGLANSMPMSCFSAPTIVHNEFDDTDSGSATKQVIANSLLSIGLENVACGKKVFLNFDHGLLMGGLHSMLPQETTGAGDPGVG